MRFFSLPMAVALLAVGGAGTGALPAPPANYSRIAMHPDTHFLTAEERQVVNLLIRAADAMTAIFERQAGGSDRTSDGLYPAGATKAELDRYLARHPAQRESLLNPYAVVRRRGAAFVAVPYNVEYRAELAKAAALLEKAAAITSNPSLRNFLKLRAQSFRSNDYYPSELAWLDITDTPIDIAIGPYETYDDALYGQKTAFEAYVMLKNPAESADLAKYKDLLRDMEANLPVEDRYKNFKRATSAPIFVAEQVRGGGENIEGPQTIAINLPNDERVREAKGAKKIILSNVLGAKYDGILKQVAPRVLVSDQAALVSRKDMTLHTLFHELSHSLGPGSITINGRATTVSAELGDIGDTAEEAKADIMGAYNVLYMIQRGLIPEAERKPFLATVAAEIFRAARWGDKEAHGRGAALQYGYLKSKGAFIFDAAAGRYRIDYDAMQAGLRDMVGDIIRLQGNGDYKGMVAFFDRYAHLDDNARTVIATLKDIPVDIAPSYPDKI